MLTRQTTHTEKAAWPVTEKVHCSEGVASAGQAAAGAVSEVALLAVLTLQAAVARQTSTLTGALVTFVRIQNPLTTAAAVTKVLWVEEWGVAPNRRDKKWEILYVFICVYTSDWRHYSDIHQPAIKETNVITNKHSRLFLEGGNPLTTVYTLTLSLQDIETYVLYVSFGLYGFRIQNICDWLVSLNVHQKTFSEAEALEDMVTDLNTLHLFAEDF